MVNESNNTFKDLLKRLNVIIHVNCLTYYLAHLSIQQISDVIITNVIFTCKIDANSLLEKQDMKY